MTWVEAFRIRILPDACISTSYGAEMMRGVRFFGTVVSADPSGDCDLEVHWHSSFVQQSHPTKQVASERERVALTWPHAVS
eukprot:5135717-Amphidinium_carterae.1